MPETSKRSLPITMPTAKRGVVPGIVDNALLNGHGVGLVIGEAEDGQQHQLFELAQVFFRHDRAGLDLAYHVRIIRR